jgi:DNA-binding NarL/FixJ family response regulator
VLIRVLIVEDSRILAEGLRDSLERHDDLQVVGVAHTVADATHLAGQERPAVILMDYHLPDGTGVEATEAIRGALPEAAIVLLSGDTTEETRRIAVQAGVNGFLPKSQPVMTHAAAAVRRAAGVAGW